MTSGSILLALAVLALLAAVGVALWTHLRTRRMLDTLDRMLDDAIRGEFRESLYDESRLSALETRMAHYLSASTVSAKNLAEEKDKIKTLIGDISHQTKTPIANLLLYAQLLGAGPAAGEPGLRRRPGGAGGKAAVPHRRAGEDLPAGDRRPGPAPGARPPAAPAGGRRPRPPRGGGQGHRPDVEPAELTARFDPKWTGRPCTTWWTTP